MANAFRHASIASSGFPINSSERAMSWWTLARRSWNLVTAGLAFTNFCQMADAFSYEAIACSGFPVLLITLPMPQWLRARLL